MHVLRAASILPRLVLAWFVLTLGVAVASPVMHPKTVALICSDGGSMKLIVVDEDGKAVNASQHTLDCSLCLPVSLPPAPLTKQAAQPQPLAHALDPVEAAHIAALVGAALPARGPPRLS